MKARACLEKAIDMKGGDPDRRIFGLHCLDECMQVIVWTGKYRAQLLHHAVVMNSNQCVFVCADKEKIIYAVVVHMSNLEQVTYKELLLTVTTKVMWYTDMEQNVDIFSLARGRPWLCCQ